MVSRQCERHDLSKLFLVSFMLSETKIFYQEKSVNSLSVKE